MHGIFRSPKKKDLEKKVKKKHKIRHSNILTQKMLQFLFSGGKLGPTLKTIPICILILKKYFCTFFKKLRGIFLLDWIATSSNKLFLMYTTVMKMLKVIHLIESVRLSRKLKLQQNIRYGSLFQCLISLATSRYNYSRSRHVIQLHAKQQQ